jgi:lantibiotic modifying enzyme
MLLHSKKAALKDFNKSEMLSKNTFIKNEEVFNTVVKWVNDKFSNKNHHLYTLQNIKTMDHTLIKGRSTEDVSEDNFRSFYLRSGELLALLYVLNIKSLDEKSIISVGQCPVVVTSNIEFNTKAFGPLFYANEIARTIMDNSVYKLKFLPNNKLPLKEEYVGYIKQGFSIIYDIAVKNKSELLSLINKFTENENLFIVLSRVQNLSLGDMRNQLFFIQGRFSSSSTYKTYIDFSECTIPSSIDKERLMSMACKIGDHIIERSIIGYKDSEIERTWIDTMGNGIVAPMDSSLYSGNSGVALFLAYLGAITNKPYFISATMEAMEPVIRYVKEEKKAIAVYSSEDIKELSEAVYTLSNLHKLTCGEKNKTLVGFTKEMVKLEAQLYKKEVEQIKSGYFNGLSRTLVSKLMVKRIGYNDDLLYKEIRDLTETIINKGVGDNLYYVCRNLRLLTCAAYVLKDKALKNRCDNTFNLIINNVIDDYKLNKFNLFEQSVSLMNGLAGIGYSLIKQCNEDIVPEILFFEKMLSP